MVVCKFYLQGYCKFGNSCRYEHGSSYAYERQESEYFQNRNTPSYHSGKFSQELQDFVKSVQDDVLRSTRGGQWPLSCYAPFRQRPCIPDWQDLSPEEMRWMMYGAAQSGSVETCEQQLKDMLRKAEAQRTQILGLTADVYSILDKVYKGEVKDATTFSFVPNANSSDSVVFGAPPVFGSPPVFGGGQAAGSSPTINTFTFALPQIEQGRANTVLGTSSPTQNVNTNFPQQNQNMFGNAAVQQGSIFGSGSVTSTNQSSIFGGILQPRCAFTREDPSTDRYTFEAPPVTISSNAFGPSSKSVFGPSPIGTASLPVAASSVLSPEESTVYSARSELTEEEISQFLNPTFSLVIGKIPTKPPPKDLCI